MAIFDSTGNQIDSKVAAEISEVVWDMVAKAFQYSEDNLDNIDKNRSLMDFFREHLPEIVKDPKRRALVLQEAHVWGSVIGDSISRQSLKCFFLEECIGGRMFGQARCYEAFSLIHLAEDTFVAKTYEKILAEIAAMALSHANIQFNEEVIFLDTPTSYEPNASSTPQTIVHTRSGKRQTFNEVVITAPLGWLKRNARKLFRKEAPLPPRLLRAIDNLGYGRLEKVYVAFPTSFWHASKDSRFTATFASSRSEASRAVSVPASSTLLQSGASIEYPFLTHFHNPKYIQHPSNVAWDQSMVNLAALPEPTAQPTLLFYLYGDCGTHLLSLISKERTATHPPQTLSPPSSHAHHNKGDRTYSILLSFFKPYYSRLPGYLDNKAACQPSFFVTTNWQKDPCAGHGSYTNFPVGLARGDRDIKVLRSGGVEQEAVKSPRTAKVDSSSPVANKDKSAASSGKDGRKTKIDTRSTPENKANTDPPRNLGDIEASRGVGFTRGVWLSGEHTAPLIATGTTTGAYWSGEQAAARLLRLYGIDCKKYLT